MSNAMAILLQTLSARLGIVRGRDLAQACRETYPRAVNLALWALCEIAVAACDLAEVSARPSPSTCCSTFRCWPAS
jgi:manganese transport protein